MNRKHLFVAVATVLFAAVSCQKPVIPDSLEVSPKDLAFAINGGEQTVTVTASSDWTATTDADWLTIIPAEDGKSFSVKASANEAAAGSAAPERKGTVTVALNNGGLKVTINATQTAEAKVFKVLGDTAPAEFPVEGGSLNITVQHNVTYQISGTNDWLTKVETKAVADDALTFNVAANAAYEKREATLTFTPATGSPVTVAISQAAALRPGINKVADLLELADSVNQGNGIKHFLDENGVLNINEDLDLDGVKWTAIAMAADCPLTCNVDGKNHRIYNIVCEGEDGRSAGFIGWVGDGKEAYWCKNLVIGSKDYDFTTGKGTYDGKSSFTLSTLPPAEATGNFFYAGAIAYLHKTSTLENIVNFAAVSTSSKCTSNHRLGGIAGTMKDNSIIKNCINYGTVTENAASASTALTMGGIVGSVDGNGGSILDSKNFGDVTINMPCATSVGGIVGGVQKTGVTITGCLNEGNVVSNAPINANTNLGGIGGCIYPPAGAGDYLCANNVNRGDITYAYNGEQSATAGTTYWLTIAGCYAYSNANGSFTSAMTLKDSQNYGKITITGDARAIKVSYAGGVVGYQFSKLTSVTGCTNNGDVAAPAPNQVYIGGVSGNNNAVNDFSNNINNGKVSVNGNSNANTWVGGITGCSTTAVKFANNTNNGEINGTFSGQTIDNKALYIGGIGNVRSNLSDCVNTGKIIANSDKINVNLGGVVSFNNANLTIENCKNSGEINVSAARTATVGGVCKDLNYKTIQNCENTGNIVLGTVGTAVGGFAGQAPNTSVTVVTGGKVNCKISTNGGDAAKLAETCGMLVGKYVHADGKVPVIGSAEAPVALSGSLFGTTVTADNYKSLLQGSTQPAGITYNVTVK